MAAGRGTRASRVGAAVVAAAVLAGGCGDGDGSDVAAVAPEDFAATPAYLAAVSERTADEELRYELRLSVDGMELDEPVATGEQAGERVRIVSNLGAATGADLPLESVNLGGEDLYVHVPFLLDMPDSRLGSTERELKGLLEETDGWLRITATQLSGTSREDALQASGAVNGQSPGVMVDVISEAESARELEPAEIQGEDMVGIGAEAPFREILDAEGTDPEALADILSETFEGMMTNQGATDAEAAEFTDEILDVMLEVTTPVEVRIDGEGRLRRLSYTIDMGTVVEELADRIDLPEISGDQPEITTIIDIVDHAEPISIEPPERSADLRDRPDLFDYWAIVNLLAGPQAG